MIILLNMVDECVCRFDDAIKDSCKTIPKLEYDIFMFFSVVSLVILFLVFLLHVYDRCKKRRQRRYTPVDDQLPLSDMDIVSESLFSNNKQYFAGFFLGFCAFLCSGFLWRHNRLSGCDKYPKEWDQWLTLNWVSASFNFVAAIVYFYLFGGTVDCMDWMDNFITGV